jgi:signal transduction histidine kinase
VRLAYAPDHLVVEVSDDGRGASPVPGTAAPLRPAGGPSPLGGNGLRGMRERAEAVGGRLETGPGHSGGFVVRALLPYAANPEAVWLEPAPAEVK